VTTLLSANRAVGLETPLALLEGAIAPEAGPFGFIIATFRGCAAHFCSLVGRPEAALHWLTRAPPVIDAEALESNLRQKTLGPDFRYPHVDARLSLARLCALQHRGDEAVEWFGRARLVLDEQGARPLRAMVDFDEAWMYVRRDARGDRELARPLLDLAVRQFESIGMPGWIRRAEELAAQLS
jgi:hypothetical protein